MIIWLASYPRSGNTFFRILLNNLYSIKTYSIYDDPLFDKLKGSVEVIGHCKMRISMEEMADSNEIFLVKTHSLPSDNYPAIYLVRDGRDVLVSYSNYILSFDRKPLHKTFNEIRKLLGWNEHYELLKKLITDKNFDSYGSWSEHVKQWTGRSGLTYIVKYEDLVGNPVVNVSLLINEFFPHKNVEMQCQKIPSFEELHSKWPSFFRKGISKAWQKEMSQDLQDLFWKHHGLVMQEIGYRR